MSAPLEVRLHASLAEVPATEWNALAGGQPFLRHEFLTALEDSGCVGGRSGWEPQHLTLWRDGRLAAAAPLYRKSHSFGEYVFDWAWADAYHKAGLAYYPKLVCCVPFTPVSGRRLLAAGGPARQALIKALLDQARDSGCSSLHVLFPPGEEAGLLARTRLQLRQGVQFHWRNPGYGSFDDFLATLTRDKRKKIRQERHRVAEAGISFRTLTGTDIGARDWEFFHRCYRRTYQAHRSTPYLNLEFFLRLGASLASHVMLAVAERAGRPLAAALNVFTDDTLYGRYWGALEQVPCLHFETCYYQAIEFCIARGIAVFEGGAQGEHKLARGFLPVRTFSAHWLRDARFADAVARFLARESQGVELYLDELNERNPFRR
ncbi:MAG: GNAT family N-acetyltransferase [Pseudomonadota bacterium]